MSYNGSGTFNINSTGQPVVAGTVITASAFNALTTDLATGLTTAITKDGQTTTTARITFAQGITSSLVTDSSSVSTGSIITDGGMGIAKNLYVGGTLNVTGSTSLTNPVINNIKMGYTTTATAAGTTTLTISSNYRQFFTGTLAQTIVLPVTSTLVTGIAYEIENNSTGTLTVNSSGGNLVGTVPAGVCAHAVCIGTTLTTAADWDWDYISTTTITGTGANVLGTSPTITTATLASPNITTALTLTGAAGTAGQALTSGGSGVAPTWTTIAATPGGSTTQLQYNNAGAFGGISGVTTDGTRITASTTIGVGAATPSTSGSGITFPATQSASSDANTLDDYEEGSWTPVFASAGGGAASYSVQNGIYTKIGRQVVASFFINGSKNTLAAGAATITGLPFAALGGNSTQGARFIIDFYNPGGTAFISVLLVVTAGGTSCSLYIITAATTDATSTQLNLSDISTTVWYRGTVVYLTN